MAVIRAGHKGYSDTVGKLGKEAYHVVVLLWRKNGNLPEAQYASQTFAPVNSFFRIFLSGDHDVVGTMKNAIVTVFHPVNLTSRHGMGCDKFNVRPEHFLNIVNNA